MRTTILIAVFLFASCSGNQPAVNNSNRVTSTDAVPSYTYEIIKAYPHDQRAFTQGLIFYDGVFYEGTGGNKRSPVQPDDAPIYSSLRKVEILTGKVLQKHDLAPEYFGEGIAVIGDKIYQLTWREQTAFVYGLSDLKPIKEFRYSGDGWGLTTDGTKLYMSDGTHVIRVVEPETFETKGTIVVKDERGRPIMQINELEWVKGEIWANVYQTGSIIRIDPQTGKLLGRIELDSLVTQEKSNNEDAAELNGIAYDEAGDRLFVTGKLWRRLFEIKIKPKQ